MLAVGGHNDLLVIGLGGFGQHLRQIRLRLGLQVDFRLFDEYSRALIGEDKLVQQLY